MGLGTYLWHKEETGQNIDYRGTQRSFFVSKQTVIFCKLLYKFDLIKKKHKGVYLYYTTKQTQALHMTTSASDLFSPQFAKSGLPKGRFHQKSEITTQGPSVNIENLIKDLFPAPFMLGKKVCTLCILWIVNFQWNSEQCSYSIFYSGNKSPWPGCN